MRHQEIFEWHDGDDGKMSLDEFCEEYIFDELHSFVDEELDVSEKTKNRAHMIISKAVRHLKRNLLPIERK